ncbi:MAG TPA: peptide-methionine (R)-S-oxide reductase MsrB [Chitinophagaceae bacterium]|nr:peptide-methionine (R)-S-oxide reductase MsrB [Chitinophagaceae bacterium]
MKQLLLILSVSIISLQCDAQTSTKSNSKKMENTEKKSNLTKEGNPLYSTTDSSKVEMSDEEWKKILPANIYQIARMKGTERPWSSKLENFYEKGTYYCAACGNPLFKSDTKFDSGCGWPSFYEPISKTSIIYTPDNSMGMKRTETQCGRCEAHLGHVFEDGPPPTGLRYCINGVVLDFAAAKEAEKKYRENKKSEQ